MRTNHNKRNIIFFLGNSINNSDINEALFNFRNSMSESDVLVLDSVIDVDGQEGCLEFYGVDDSIHEWLIKIPESLGFKKEDLEIGTRFKNNRVEIFFKINNKKTIKKDENEIVFNEGDEIIALVSYRYKIEDFRSFLTMNFNQVEIKSNKKGSLVIVLCKK